MRTYRIIIFGPPGSGKGTQAKLIAERYKVEHISTGDIFRAKGREDTALGRKIKELIDNGKYVPEEITIPIIKKKVKRLKGFVLDGFPRTISQAEALKTFAGIDYVFYIDVSEKTLVERLSSRLMCRCGESYNKITKPPKTGDKCDKCGKKLFQREDEKPEVVAERLKFYNEKTKPLLEFYKEVLIRIDGEPSIAEVFKQIKKVLG